MKQNTPPGQRFSLDDLCTLTGLSKRTVRYYIQIGLVDRPAGETRAAHYTNTHVEQLVQVLKWTKAGVSLDRVRELMVGGEAKIPPRPRGAGTVEVWSHFVVADGVEMTLEPGRAGLSPEQVRAFFRGVAQVYKQIHESEGKE